MRCMMSTTERPPGLRCQSNETRSFVLSSPRSQHPRPAVLLPLPSLNRLRPKPGPQCTASALPLAAASAAVVAAVDAGAGVPLGRLLLTSTLPVLKVALFCVVGAYASRKGLLTAPAAVSLSALTFRIFTPCLMFTKLGMGKGVAEAIATWPLTANMVLSHVLGALLGLLLVRTVAVPPGLTKHLVLANTIGNVGNMPWLMAASLASDPGLPFLALLGPAATDLAQRYIALSMISATLIQFPLAYLLMKPSEQPPASTTTALTADRMSSPASSTSSTSSTSSAHTTSSDLGRTMEAASRSGVASSSSKSGGGSGTVVGQQDNATGTGAGAGEGPSTSSRGNGSSGSGGSMGSKADNAGGLLGLWKRWQPLIQGIITPPTIGCLAGIAVASNAPVKAAFFSPGGPLVLLGEVIDMLGAITIPSMLMVLGANLSRGPGGSSSNATKDGSSSATKDSSSNATKDGSSEDASQSSSSSGAGGGIPWGCALATIASRLVVLPVLGCAAVMLAYRSGLLGPQDPLALLVMLMMHCVPSAVLVHSMATLFNNRQDDVAALLFWQYLACLVTLPPAIGVCLKLVGAM